MLRSLEILGPELALRVGRHLAAAGLLIDDDPDAALEHARYARQRAPRLSEVREALGVAAYAAGDYALARSELRTARRMSDAPELLPLLADCERALGRPDDALVLCRDPAARQLPRPEQLELLMVASGARLDLGQPGEALRVLGVPEIEASDEQALAEPVVLRVWYAYADALVHAGKTERATSWFVRIAGLDDEITDAADRVRTLSGLDEPSDDDGTDEPTALDGTEEPTDDDGTDELTIAAVDLSNGRTGSADATDEPGAADLR